MISAGDFRNGVTIEFEGNIYQIIEFQHVKPGKGAAFVRTKLKNIISGGVVEKTFRPTEKCPTAHIDRKDMQYLYADDDFYHFMDVETYDQIDLPKDEVGDALKFVKENEMCKVCSHKGNVFAVEPPLFVELTVQRQSLASRVIQQQVLQSLLQLRQVLQFMYHFLLRQMMLSRLIQEQVSTFHVYNL